MEAPNGHVLLINGDPPARTRIAKQLAEGGYSCHEVSTGDDALQAARTGNFAAVVLAVVLSGTTGYDVCRALREEHGELLPIIFVSKLRKDPLDRVAGLALGADDYLTEPWAPEELVARVRRCVTRASAVRDQPRANDRQLTPREAEVLTALAKGLSQNAIAEELIISPKTVATHIQRILEKLDVHSRAEAVSLAYREGLVPPGIDRRRVTANAPESQQRQ